MGLTYPHSSTTKGAQLREVQKLRNIQPELTISFPPARKKSTKIVIIKPKLYIGISFISFTFRRKRQEGMIKFPINIETALV